jgi:putative membrane protein
MKRMFAAMGFAIFATAASAQTAPPTSDFVKTVATSDMFEIESSKVALDKKISADKAFAQRMVHDHTQTTEQLNSLIKAHKVEAQLPAGLDDQHKEMLEKLRGESGADFSRDYNEMQLSGHKAAVALFEAYAKGGDNAALKSWAAKTLPHLQEHLALAEKLSLR